MAPHSRLLKCLDILKIDDNLRTLIKNSLKTWRTDLICEGAKIGAVKIKRGIFQEDELSPMLFIITLYPLSLMPRDMKVGYDLGK